MIMAAITDTPCIVFDNSTHKVKGVYKWIEKIDFIQFLESDQEFDKVINNALNESHKSLFSDWNQEVYLQKLAAWFI